ncbi:Protein FAM47E [Pteropus alecto]|uniref:Protein FAM47E n=1 Tax=Pteropus alecto TaxID=9402 RepID=L5KG44_PTEAL|nr:Protein FAM47E [Pteropus alecto]
MVDKKWLLGPRTLEPMPLGMNCKPWYQDKLPSKCFAKHKNRFLKFPTSLDSRQWIFVKEGLDDFRMGCPPCENMITRGPMEGFLPIIDHRVSQPASKKSRKKLPAEVDMFSTLSPAQQARKAFVEDSEASLTKCPLTHYLNLEESLPEDLLLNVLEVLYPDKKLEDTCTYCQGTRKRMKSPTKLREKPPAEIYLEPPKKTPLKPSDNSLPEKKRKKKSDTKDFPKGSPLHRKIPRAVRKFCRWVDTFGDLGIDEEFIMKQFDIGHECNPTYGTGKIKKISQVPLELRYSIQLDPIKERKFSLQEDTWERKLQKPYDPYKPNRVKIRYGAWYLKPKLWKKLINDEPLLDPLLEDEGGIFGKNREPDIIDDLYGTIAFKDFIVSKGYDMPGVLEKLFMRKGWNYDSVNTPIHRVMKLSSTVDDDSEEDD